MAIDYEDWFTNLTKEYASLTIEKERIEEELARLAPVLQSTYRMLTAPQRGRVAKITAGIDTRCPGLKEGVLMAFKASDKEWLTPPEIRDYLETIGFDYGAASDRGLSSIGTTLKRMVPEEMHSKALENGQIAYRPKGMGIRKAALLALKKSREGDTKALYDSGMRGDEKPKASINDAVDYIVRNRTRRPKE